MGTSSRFHVITLPVREATTWRRREARETEEAISELLEHRLRQVCRSGKNKGVSAMTDKNRKPGPEPTSDDEAESLHRIELGAWHGLKAYWGYSKGYDCEGLTVCDGNGEEIGFYSDGDLDLLLYRFGSMGCYYLIFRGDAWKAVPDLCGNFSRLYQRWGC